jgi:hypothetical protein
MQDHAVTAGEIVKAGFKWSYADQADRRLRSLAIGEPLIVNTDLTGGEGVHWVVLTRLSGGHIYLYDPLGPSNDRVASDGSAVDLPYTHIYPYESQLSSTGHCGYFAVYVARIIRRLMRAAGNRDDSQSRTSQHDRLTPLAITNAIKAEFGRSADWGDAKRVAASGVAYAQH